MFYRTGKRFTCTRTKLGKLLAIVAFKYARDGKVIFDKPVYKYDEKCGAVVSGLAMIVDRDVYLNYSYSDNTEFSEKERIEVLLSSKRIPTYPVPEKYKDIDDLSDDVKECIDEVFKLFGGYSAYVIGQDINDLIDIYGIVRENGRIDLNRIHDLSEKDVESIKKSRLIDYLF